MSSRRIALSVLIPVLAIALAVFGTARIERDSAVRGGDQADASQLMLTSMLDQETGARGYFETRDPRFLEPWFQGTTNFTRALTTSRALAGGSADLLRALDDQARRAAALHDRTAGEIQFLSRDRRTPSAAQALVSKAMMDGFRSSNAAYDAALKSHRDRALNSATLFAVLLAAALSGAFVVAAILLARRAQLGEARRLRRQRELRELLQVSESEEESRRLLIRHIERIVPGSGAAVMIRNNSDDRLEPVLGASDGTPALAELARAELKPRSCMAVRLSRTYERGGGEEPLLACEACGEIPGEVSCEPLLVGGQVIGSVLVTRERAFAERERTRLRDAVIQAAPILANQRNLALAETRAASDPLTGLPNRRAADETLARMAAHAGRTVSPLALVLLDLDHFKQINDIHGHERGDRALAAVAQILAAGLRGSDFAARYGGEEFLLLLPDTDREGAVAVAEKLRATVERADMAPVSSVTASFGVSILPDDASEIEQLMRKADRALYSAKAAGRNRVRTAADNGAPRRAASDTSDLPED